jgi:hypothetical protein
MPSISILVSIGRAISSVSDAIFSLARAKLIWWAWICLHSRRIWSAWWRSCRDCQSCADMRPSELGLSRTTINVWMKQSEATHYCKILLVICVNFFHSTKANVKETFFKYLFSMQV